MDPSQLGIGLSEKPVRFSYPKDEIDRANESLSLLGKYMAAFTIPLVAACCAAYFGGFFHSITAIVGFNVLSLGVATLSRPSSPKNLLWNSENFHRFRHLHAAPKVLALVLKGLAIGGLVVAYPASLLPILLSVAFGLISTAVINLFYPTVYDHQRRQDAVLSAANHLSMAGLIATGCTLFGMGSLTIPGGIALLLSAVVGRAQFLHGTASLLNIHRHPDLYIHPTQNGWRNAASLALGFLWLA